MKKIRKVIFILIIILLIFAGAVYIDYFIASRNNTHPKIALKKKIDGGLFVYNGVFYRMWYCKATNTYTIGDYKDSDAVCVIVYDYDKGFYSNGAGIKISKHDLEMIKDVYDSEVIETMNSDNVVENAVYVAENYAKLDYKVVEKDGKELKTGKYSLVNLPKFEEKNDKYSWVIDEEKQYCLDDSKDIKLIAPFEENQCGEFVNLTYDKKWCELYTNSKLVFDEKVNDMCKGVEQ